MSGFRNRLLKSVSGDKYQIVSIADSIAGDVVLYNTSDGSKVIVNGKFNKDVFPADTYIPIGIVAIPGNHQLYGQNTCGVISLVEMSCTTPFTGTTTSASMCFGPQSEYAITNYNVVIIKDDDTLKTNGFGYLSKNGLYNSTTLKIPDPYLDNGLRNPDYYNTTVSAFNAMSDFKGKANSNTMLGIRGLKNYLTWKPAAMTANDYPAVSCCDMFSTPGTAQGQWFLPAAGEWGYITSKWNKLQDGLNLVNNIYGDVALLLADNSSYWTCTEHNTKNNRYVHTNNGMGHTTKTSAMKIRALTILKEDLSFPIYLQTEMLDSDFYRRKSDTLALDIIDWYNMHCTTSTNGHSSIDVNTLSGKIFIDDAEVTAMYFDPTESLEFLFFETNKDYGLDEPYKVIQYRPQTTVEKGTIDIM